MTLATATAGATIRYTIDGSDPTNGSVYTAPFSISATTTVRATASHSCMWPSEVATALFTQGGGTVGATSIHLGNSLTDTVNDYLQPVAAAGGKNLAYNRYTVPGVGTWIYHDMSTGGGDCCSGDIHSWMTTHTPIDHLSMQPFQNMPCSPDG